MFELHGADWGNGCPDALQLDLSPSVTHAGDWGASPASGRRLQRPNRPRRFLSLGFSKFLKSTCYETAPFGASSPRTDLNFLPQVPRFAAKLVAVDISVRAGDERRGAGRRSGWGARMWRFEIAKLSRGNVSWRRRCSAPSSATQPPLTSVH